MKYFVSRDIATAERFDRTKRLIGNDGLDKLKKAKVLIFGLGGVGSYVCEALARAGVGYLAIADRDIVAVSNINRQIIALDSTVGMKKTDAAAARLADINPELKIDKYFISFDKETAEQIDFGRFDFVVDAIDSLPAKVLIAIKARAANVPVISCMGTGFRLDPSRLKITDIFSTSGCPLARLMRKELRNAGIDSLKVVFSDEKPILNDRTDVCINNPVCYANTPQEVNGICEPLQQTLPHNNIEPRSQTLPQKTIASISFVPSVAGLLIAGEVVRFLIKETMNKYQLLER